MRREISWEEAELIRPGIRAEWRLMNESPPTPSYRLGGMTEADVRLELDVSRVHVIRLDPEGYWKFPPSWVSHGSGSWTSPLPLPRSLADIDYSRWP